MKKINIWMGQKTLVMTAGYRSDVKNEGCDGRVKDQAKRWRLMDVDLESRIQKADVLAKIWYNTKLLSVCA